MARRVGRLAVALPEPLSGVVTPRAGADRERSMAPGVAFPFRARPLSAGEAGADEPSAPTGCFLPIAAWVVDLALRAAGFTPVPLSVQAGETPGSDALVAEAARRGASVLALPGDDNGGTVGRTRSRRRPEGPGESSRWLDDCQLDATSWRIRSLAETPAAVDPARPAAAVSSLTAARRLVDLAGEGPSGRGRARRSEIAVAGRGPADAGDRLLVAWSLLTGGVLLLEANPEARVATAAWSRPTLFLGDSGELSRLRQEAQEWDERRRGGWLRRVWLRRGGLLGVSDEGMKDNPLGPPFGRLHTLVLRGGGVPGPSDEPDFWSSRGVRQVDLASLVQ